MNLTIPHSWLKEFCPVKLSPEKIAERVSLSGPSIDRVIRDGGDTLYDVEITTNRPDGFSVIGFAREVCAILGLPFAEPLDAKRLARARAQLPQKPLSGAPALTVRIEEPELCSRYIGLVVDGVHAGPSPAWMQKRLIAAGARPINVIVDITNYVLLEYGQPLHAFDAEKVVGKTHAKEIIVRCAKNGEAFTTLDGEEKKLNASMLVIADQNGPLALAGIKGGARSGISASTRTIILEAAHFNAVNIRKTSRSVDIRTDSSSRFEKDLARELPPYAILRAAELVAELAGGRIAGPMVDCYPSKRRQTVIPFLPADVTRILGVPISVRDATRALRRLGFGVRHSGTKLIVSVPFWREGDVENSRDCVEEVGRLVGYNTMPLESVRGPIPLDAREPLFYWESRAKHFLKDRGWTEVMNYSFVPKNLLEKANIEVSDAIAVWNPLSLEFECMRPTLVPSMLATIASNEQKTDVLALFELSRAYIRGKKNELADERLMLVGALQAKMEGQELFRSLKGSIEALFSEWFSSTAVRVSFHSLVQGGSFVAQSAGVRISFGSTTIGFAGVARAELKHAFGIKQPLALFELDMTTAAPFFTAARAFAPIPKYPSVERDIAAVISKQHTYASIASVLRSADPLIANVRLFDVFDNQKLGTDRHSLAFRLTYADPLRTLTADEADRAHEKVRLILKEQFGAELR